MCMRGSGSMGGALYRETAGVAAGVFSSAVVVAVVESAGTHPGENSVSVIAVVGAAVSAAGGRRFAAGVAATSGV